MLTHANSDAISLLAIPSHAVTDKFLAWVTAQDQPDPNEPNWTVDDYFPRAGCMETTRPLIEYTELPNWRSYFDGFFDRWYRNHDRAVEVTTAKPGTLDTYLIADNRTTDERGQDEWDYIKECGNAARARVAAKAGVTSERADVHNSSGKWTPREPASPRADEAFDYAIDAPTEESEGLFPMGEISLVAGASGAGKSTWSLDMLEKQALGEKILGRETKKLAYLALLTDRGPNALKRTARRMRINLATLPHARLRPGADVVDRIERLYLEHGKPEILYLEGIDLLVGENTAENVGPLIEVLQDFAYHYHVAVIGTVGVPKMKPNEKFTQKRERVIGTQLWGRVTETLVYIDRDHAKDAQCDTLVSVLLRQGQEEEYPMRFDRGRLVHIEPREMEQREMTENQQRLLNWLQEQDGDFTIGAARRVFRGMSHTTIKKKLDEWTTAGYLSKRTRKADGKTFYKLTSAIAVS